MTIKTLSLMADRFRQEGDQPFRVRVLLDDGREQTVECWAANNWKARTASMFLVDFGGLRGALVDYEVTPITGDI